MMNRLHVVFTSARRFLSLIARPLRSNPAPDSFRVSTAETHTTTGDGGIGWAERPPAQVLCPQCSGTINQHNARDDIDCPHCTAEFSHEAFPDLDLDGLQCPECGDRMEHGQRHPHAFDVPEWATCHRCRYHWEFKHSF